MGAPAWGRAARETAAPSRDGKPGSRNPDSPRQAVLNNATTNARHARS